MFLSKWSVTLLHPSHSQTVNLVSMWLCTRWTIGKGCRGRVTGFRDPCCLEGPEGRVQGKDGEILGTKQCDSQVLEKRKCFIQKRIYHSPPFVNENAAWVCLTKWENLTFSVMGWWRQHTLLSGRDLRHPLCQPRIAHHSLPVCPGVFLRASKHLGLP